MTAQEIAKCEEWLKNKHRVWQTLNRKQWKYQFRGKTLVRYVEETNMDETIVPLLLEYLTATDGSGGYLCSSTLRLYGQDIDTAWTPTAAWYEVSNKSAGNIRAVRLYHALTTDPEANVDGPFVVEDGCAYKVTLTYYFGVTTVPDAPPSTSGISYRITSLSHDPDTDLYSYVLEKRERVQQDIPEYTTDITTTIEKGEEVHLGVRGDLDVGGKQASVVPGKRISRKVSKNADCTHDVHNIITEELASPAHSVSVSVGLTGSTRTVADLHMPSPLDADNLDIGERVENTLTDTGRYNRSHTTRVLSFFRKIAESCRKTIFGHAHSETNVQGTDPGFTHVVEAEGGVVHDKSVRRLDNGNYQVTDATTTETPVQNARESVSVSITGKRRSVTHRNQAEPGAEPTEIGTSVENVKTEGGLYNVTYSQRVAAFIGKIAESCRKTIYLHSHSETKVQGTDPGFTHVVEAENGVITDKSVRRTDDGYQVTDETRRELGVRDSSTTWRQTLRGLFKRVTHRHQTSAPDPSSLQIGESLTVQKTDGNLYDVTIDSIPVRGAGKTDESCRQDYYTHHHATGRNVKAEDAPEAEVTFETGKIETIRVSKNNDGTADVSEDVNTAKPQLYRYTYRRDDGATVHVVQWRNQLNRWEGYPDGADGLSVGDNVNAYGLHDGHCTWLTDAPYKTQVGDLKFIKHGNSIDIFQVTWNALFRRYYHRTLTVQWHHICGDAYTDYLEDMKRANPDRKDMGVMYVKLLAGPYYDKDGNRLAEWKWIQLHAASAWTPCDGTCKHAMQATSNRDIDIALKSILDAEDAKSINVQAEREKQETAKNAPMQQALWNAAFAKMQTPKELLAQMRDREMTVRDALGKKR